MRLLASLLLGTLAATLALHTPVTHAKPASTKVMAWRLKKGAAQVTLLGSVHVARKDVYPLDPRIEKAFAQSETLVLETSMDPATMQQAAMSMQRAALYVPPDRLDKHVPAETINALRPAFAELGLPPQMVLMMRPFMVAMTVTLTKLASLGFHPELGIDQHFYEAAKGKKKVEALETVEEQVALLTGMDEPTQVAMLKQTAQDLAELGPTMGKAFEAWKRGDVKALDKLLVAPTRKAYPAVHKRMITDRNRRMADKIAGYLKGAGNTFVVVGSAHLIGPDSIVRMLKKRGFSASQL